VATNDARKVGEELFFGGGRRFRVLDVVIFDEETNRDSWSYYKQKRRSLVGVPVDALCRRSPRWLRPSPLAGRASVAS
jgi:hypothetical protein